ncbi:MAG: hypothetical protein HN403_01760 [Rhodospirillales bacterium]|jgi:hypothetical protein|nr:hypothetical protein [Rhodospirillales bacterium]
MAKISDLKGFVCPSPTGALEEHTNLEVREPLGAYYFENGYTITGGKVLHNWV